MQHRLQEHKPGHRVQRHLQADRGAGIAQASRTAQSRTARPTRQVGASSAKPATPAPPSSYARGARPLLILTTRPQRPSCRRLRLRAPAQGRVRAALRLYMHWLARLGRVPVSSRRAARPRIARPPSVRQRAHAVVLQVQAATMVSAALPTLLSLAALAFPVAAQELDAQPAEVLRLTLTATGMASGSGRRLKRQSHIPVESQRDQLYTVDAAIGTPPRLHTLIFDLGSSDLWVNPNCGDVRRGDRKFCKGKRLFNEKESKTYKDLNSTRFIKYGTGWASLSMGSDIVTLGCAFARPRTPCAESADRPG